MTSPRKKPTAGFWITVALVAVLPVLYIALSGPIAGLDANNQIPAWADPIVYFMYSLLWWLGEDGPDAITKPLHWWWDLWL